MTIIYIIDPEFVEDPIRVPDSDISTEDIIKEINRQGFIPWTVFINKSKINDKGSKSRY